MQAILPKPCAELSTPASADPADSLQLLGGDPAVTLRAASPCTFKAPGVEQYTPNHPELPNMQTASKIKHTRAAQGGGGKSKYAGP